MQLHAEIDAEDEYRQIKPYSHAVAPGDLFVELIKEERTAGLLVVFADSPYVSCIQERRELKETQHFVPVLDIHIQPDVPCLFVIDERTAVAAEGTGSQGACLPSADTVGAAAEIAFLERQYLGVQVRHDSTDAYMSDQMVLGGDDAVVGEVDLSLGILGKGNPPKDIRAVVVLLESRGSTQAV